MINLSIVIPTKNRSKTLLFTVERMLSLFPRNGVELVVHDNSNNHTDVKALDKLRLLNDPRLKVYHVEAELDAVQNCDLALACGSGKYVTFIGDDDFVTPRILDIVYQMDKQKLDSLNVNFATYTWHDVEHKYAVNSKLNGSLIYQGDYNEEICDISIKAELKNVLSRGLSDLGRLPRVYQGIVSYEALEKLRSKTNGTYFPGPVPDMSNAIGLSCLELRHGYVDFPYIISGHSKKSMSGKNNNREHQGNISDERSIPLSANVQWSQSIPRFWSAPTIWAEAMVKAFESLDQSDCLKSFNYPLFYARCFAFSNGYDRTIWSAVKKKYSKSCFRIRILIYVHRFRIWCGRVSRFASKSIFGIQALKYYDNIYDAAIALERK